MIDTKMATFTESMVQASPADDKIATNDLSLLEILALLAAEKRFILRFFVGAAALSTLLAFLLPVRYEANTVMLPPQRNSSVGSALMGQIAGGSSLGALAPLASLAGGSLALKNPADMYVSLLTSRTVEDALIQHFNLMSEYREKRLSDARKELERRTTAVAGSKDGLIRITVEDRDPKRAADLANSYVEEFRKLSATLAITEAARRRLFFEQQLQQAKNNLSAAEEAMKATQQSTGVLQIESQARSLIESAAILRGQVAAKQVQIQSMRSFAAEDNPRLILAKQELAALQDQLDKLADSQQDNGSDIVLSKGRVTGAGLEYLRHLRDLKYNETVFELLAKQFEIAKLDEAREGSMIQVVDAAVPPDKRSSPHRLLIIASVTFTAFFVAAFWVVFRQRWSLASQEPQNRQQLDAIRNSWKRAPAGNHRNGDSS